MGCSVCLGSKRGGRKGKDHLCGVISGIVPDVAGLGRDTHAVTGAHGVAHRVQFQLQSGSGVEKGNLLAGVALGMDAGAGVRRDHHHTELDPALCIRGKQLVNGIRLGLAANGGPGGVAFGLKQVFGDAVHCFFAEPTNACCMLLGMATGLHNGISVQDLGIDGRTVADGLAVGRASGFVGRLMEPFMSGCYTLTDERMHRMLAQLADAEDIWLEPSALAGMYGPVLTCTHPEFAEYRKSEGATHLVWATGGSMVPPDEMRKYYLAGK